MPRAKRGRKVFVVLEVPELGFIPVYDREGMSISPYGVLTNKIFKYRGEREGRILYAELINRYGIDALVMEKDGMRRNDREREYASAQKPLSDAQPRLF